MKTLLSTIAATALVASMFATVAQASINPIEIDIAPEIAAPVTGATYAHATYGATTVEEFEERLIRQSDDGTLGPNDIMRIRMFEDRLQSASVDTVTFGASVEVAQWHPEAEALKERLERQSDDGTLNDQDYQRVRQLHQSRTS